MFTTTKSGVLGFDLGATSVKAAQIVRKDGEFLLRAGAIVPRRALWTTDSFSEKRPLSSADEMAAAASICDLSFCREAAALLPMTLCDVLQVQPPSSKRTVAQEIARAVETETRRPAAERVIDYWSADLPQPKLNIVAAPKNWSDQISADVASVGFHCRVIDALPWALARAVSLAGPTSTPGAVAALDWGFGKATLVMIRQGAPVLVRSLKDCGLHHVLSAVESGLRVGPRDAERILFQYGSAAPDQSPAAANTLQEVIAAPLARLVAEAFRTIAYWQNVTRIAAEFVYLFGGGASIPGLESKLRDALQVDAKTWTLPLEDSREAEFLPPPHLLGPAIGLSALPWGSP